MRTDAPNISARLRLRVTAAAESQLRSGHPWLYAESIREQNRAAHLGELAVVYDRKDRFLALGLFDPDSTLRLRVLHAGKPQTVDRAWWSARLEQALAKRAHRFDAQTTGFRWINGESDGWPGLVLDRYDRTLALKLYTAAWLPRLKETVELLTGRLHPERIVLRLSRNIQKVAESQFAMADGQLLVGPPLEGPVLFMESSLRFEADVLRGQKTGFFLDQRENRRRVETLASGRTVLNAFSFSGGFSLYAARGGATAVTDLDISAHALQAAKRNFALNQSLPPVAGCRHQRIQADAFEWLAANTQRKLGLIILDPPSFARRESERSAAIRAYSRLAALGLSHLSPGGILVACSCSAHVTAEEFFKAVRHAIAQSGRKLEEVQTTQHPVDHPAAFKEAEYLKAVYLREQRGRGVVG
ncbi:MAG TPA: class I SAM-dependent methyltransferase [Candidatus Acidoferrum sp.]|jgi:23S rRNA (cytosine1962-C5)-methyltransferase|nr:class I SAM-dependent methyltransferase [Candidatus Acidoferrum sp.]